MFRIDCQGSELVLRCDAAGQDVARDLECRE